LEADTPKDAISHDDMRDFFNKINQAEKPAEAETLSAYIKRSKVRAGLYTL